MRFPSPVEIQSFLQALRTALRRGEVRVTRSAQEQAFEDFQYDREALLQTLHWLEEGDLQEIVESLHDQLPLWVFKPSWGEALLYIKIGRRNVFIVISYHEDLS